MAAKSQHDTTCQGEGEGGQCACTCVIDACMKTWPRWHGNDTNKYLKACPLLKHRTLLPSCWVIWKGVQEWVITQMMLIPKSQRSKLGNMRNQKHQNVFLPAQAFVCARRLSHMEGRQTGGSYCAAPGQLQQHSNQASLENKICESSRMLNLPRTRCSGTSVHCVGAAAGPSQTYAETP
jgi:hypothetical protein